MNRLAFALVLLAVGSAGAETTSCETSVDVTFYTPNIVRVVRNPARTEAKKFYPIVSALPEKVSVSVRQDAEKKVWRTSELEVALDKASGRLVFSDASGKVLLEEDAEATFPEAVYSGGRRTTRVAQRRFRIGLPNGPLKTVIYNGSRMRVVL